MRTTFASLKFILITLFGLPAAIMIGFSGFLMNSAWHQQATAQRRMEVSSVTRNLFQAMQNLRIERGTVSTALVQGEPVDSATWRDIQNLRSRSRPALAEALDELSHLDVSDRDRWSADLSTKSAAVEAIRAKVDGMLQKHLVASHSQINNQWVVAVSALVDRMDALSSRLSSDVRLEDPFFDEMMTIKQLGWSVRADAGTERLMFGDAIAGGVKVPQNWQLKIVELRGRMAAAWAEVLTFKGDKKTPKALLNAITAANETYFNRFMHVRDDIYRSLIAGDNPQITGRAWIQESNPALASLIGVANTAVDLAQTTTERTSADAERHFLYRSLLVLAAVLIGVLGLITIRRNVVAPIVTLTLAMRELAAGNTRVDIPNTDRRDELGAMARTVEVFKRAVIDNDRLRVEQDQLAARSNAEKQATAADLAKVFDSKIGNLVQALKAAARKMEGTARSMSETAEDAGRVSTLTTAFAERTSTNVQNVAAATDQLSASAREIGFQASTSASLVRAAVEDRMRTDGAVKVLSERSERIENVVRLISDIAEKTNLLALNATIEAARAGEAGRGFGVVASEVKSLAAQTAVATKEISSQIAQSQVATRDVVGAISNVGGAIEKLQNIACAIAAAVEEQHAATQEIARSVAEAASGTKEVTNNILHVRQAAADTDSASNHVLAAATALSHNSSELSHEVELFLANILAA